GDGPGGLWHAVFGLPGSAHGNAAGGAAGGRCGVACAGGSCSGGAGGNHPRGNRAGEPASCPSGMNLDPYFPLNPAAPVPYLLRFFFFFFFALFFFRSTFALAFFSFRRFHHASGWSQS